MKTCMTFVTTGKLYVKLFVLKATLKEVKCQIFSKILKKYRSKHYINFSMLSFTFTSRNMDDDFDTNT